MDAYSEGIRAFVEGTAATANPYKDERRPEWFKGYFDAKLEQSFGPKLDESLYNPILDDGAVQPWRSYGVSEEGYCWMLAIHECTFRAANSLAEFLAQSRGYKSHFLEACEECETEPKIASLGVRE